MPVVTIAGRQGSPIKKIGLEVARALGADYVDNQIISQAAQRSGAPSRRSPKRTSAPSGVASA